MHILELVALHNALLAISLFMDPEHLVEKSPLHLKVSEII